MTETAAPTGPDRGTALATTGFLMAATGPILVVAGSLLWGLDSAQAVFFVVPALLGLLAAFLVRRPRIGLRVVAIVLSIAVALTAFWTVFGLAEPSSFLDFVPGFLVLPGVLLGVVAGITSIRSQRAGRTAGPGERRAVTAIVGVLAVLGLGSLVLTVTGRDTVADDDAAEADLVVDLEDFEFDRATYDVAGGATILVKNSDPFVHTFTVDALDIDVDLGPGSETLVTIPAEPGTYVLFCQPHTSDKDDPGEDDMAAVLEVG